MRRPVLRDILERFLEVAYGLVEFHGVHVDQATVHQIVAVLRNSDLTADIGDRSVKIGPFVLILIFFPVVIRQLLAGIPITLLEFQRLFKVLGGLHLHLLSLIAQSPVIIEGGRAAIDLLGAGVFRQCLIIFLHIQINVPAHQPVLHPARIFLLSL